MYIKINNTIINFKTLIFDWKTCQQYNHNFETTSFGQSKTNQISTLLGRIGKNPLALHCIG